jgi:hypothetical protein
MRFISAERLGFEQKPLLMAAVFFCLLFYLRGRVAGHENGS